MRYRFQVGDEIYEITVERSGETFQVKIDPSERGLNGEPYAVEVLDQQAGQISLRFDGRPVTLYWASQGGVKWISMGGCAYRLDRPVPRQARASSESSAAENVRAPMPAQVRLVQVAEGDAVEKGQTLLLLEAMKMEIRVKAPAAGRVSRLLVQAGQTVEKDQALVEMGA
jgi:acetyl/propionyl-CoA carboxylase alpha subunit